ncbi:MAG: hypothetical protein K2K59_02785 [Muribaculaceae bacterium]|nr:hypothetical protein [Muribaculaceae bacterium]
MERNPTLHKNDLGEASLCLRQNVAYSRLFSPLPVRNHMERRIPIRRLINAAASSMPQAPSMP